MGKMDVLIHNFEEIVSMSKSPNSTVGALLGSRELYDRLLLGIEHADLAVGEGRNVMTKVNQLGDTLNQNMAILLRRADTTSFLLTRTAQNAEALSIKANHLAGQGEQVLARVDELLKDGSGKLDQAGDVIGAVSGLWPIKGRIDSPKEFPLLLNEAGP